MRITDSNEEYKQSHTPSPNDILNKIRPNSTVNDKVQHVIEPEQNKVVGDANGSKLKSLLKTLQNQKAS